MPNLSNCLVHAQSCRLKIEHRRVARGARVPRSESFFRASTSRLDVATIVRDFLSRSEDVLQVGSKSKGGESIKFLWTLGVKRRKRKNNKQSVDEKHIATNFLFIFPVDQPAFSFANKNSKPANGTPRMLIILNVLCGVKVRRGRAGKTQLVSELQQQLRLLRLV